MYFKEKKMSRISTCRKISVLIFTVLICASFTSYSSFAVGNNVTVGAWYCTWYSDVPTINSEWRTGFGTDAANHFIADVDNDGKEDAIVFKSDGTWYVAKSNGNGFNTPTQWASGLGVGSNEQFIGDCNGDGRADAVVFFSSTGNWYVATAKSDGTGFNNYSQWTAGFGINSDMQMLADCTGDGKKDAVVFLVSTGKWYVANANTNGTGFNQYSEWCSGFGTNSDKQMAGDVDGDGKADAVYYTGSNGQWYVADSSGSSFDSVNNYLWANGFGVGSQNQIIADGNGDGYADIYAYFTSDINGDSKSGDWCLSKNNKAGGVYPYRVANSGFGSSSSNQFVGNVTGDSNGWKASVAYYASTGTWKVERYNYNEYSIYNLWDAWNIKYTPWSLGTYQKYDSGNTAVCDEHIYMCADAKIDFLLLDETNNLYVGDEFIFDRAKTFASRINVWNSNPSNRNVKYAVAVGGLQFVDPVANPDGACQKLEWEAREVWNQFANTLDGGTTNYFNFDSKPLLVAYATPNHKTAWDNYTGDKTYADNFTIRWAFSPSTAGTYGWEVRNGSIDDDEVMVTMPGWKNMIGTTPVLRSNGDYYAISCWDKVLLKSPKPQIVMLTSFNDYAEQTAVAPADTSQVASEQQWLNKSGQLDNFMYWNMTRNYINLLKDDVYKASEGFSGGQGWYRWQYKQWNGTSYSNMTWDSVNGRWVGNQGYCLIMQNRQHPDTNDSVRTWVAPYSGSVRITGTVKKESAYGDGVIVKIVKNSTVVCGPYTITTTSGMDHDVTVGVNTGDSLYFIVNRNGNNSYDTTIWDPTITYQ